MFDKERIARIVKAAGQAPRDAQALIDLTQEQHSSIATEITCRKVGNYPARTELIKTEEQGFRADRGLGRTLQRPTGPALCLFSLALGRRNRPASRRRSPVGIARSR